VQTTTATSTQDNFAITSGPTAIYLRCNNATALTITGFATPSSGKRIEVVSIGAGSVTLANATGSTAANQILTQIGGNLVLDAGFGKATLVYDGTTANWRVQSYMNLREGTWTPVIGGSGGTSGQSYTAQVGRYVKNGKLVTAQFTVELLLKGTITTNVEIQGLPFTAENVSGLSSVAALAFRVLATNWVNVVVRVTPNTTTAAVTGAAAAAVSNLTALTTADIDNTTLMSGTIVYFAAS
jgi:hypothetical protein